MAIAVLLLDDGTLLGVQVGIMERDPTGPEPRNLVHGELWVSGQAMACKETQDAQAALYRNANRRDSSGA